jgi:hypothetical protein
MIEAILEFVGISTSVECQFLAFFKVWGRITMDSQKLRPIFVAHVFKSIFILGGSIAINRAA